MNIKDIVKDRYTKIAEANEKPSCGCGCGCNSSPAFDFDFTVISDDYQKLEGYNPDADMNLGCGLPTEFAKINKGDTVLDLGSGAGNDCFVARALVGDEGKVIGVDFTDIMIEKARKNASKLGYTNVAFLKGDIEVLPLDDEMIDVVISNCVLNLVPDKVKAFSEIYRVLKEGAHFCVSDVVIKGELSEKLQKDVEMYAGCISGALKKDEYLDIIKNTGFKNILVQKEKEIIVPIDLMKKYLDENEIVDYKSKKLGIYSVTVFATK